MSLRTLPQISFQAPGNLGWNIPPNILARWFPNAKATEGEAGISILEGIGDQWDGTGVTSKRVAAALRSIGERDVVVNINSPGGDFFEGVAIYNMLREHRGKITVKVLGLAASAASVIAMAGDEVQVAKSGFLMIHNSWAMAMGNRNDLLDMVKILGQFDGAMAGVYAERTGLPEKDIAKMMDADTWLSGTQSLEMGFSDAILEDLPEPKPESKAKSAVRQIENALAAQGLTRSQRREVLAGILRPAVADDGGGDVSTEAELKLLHELKSIFN